MTTTGHPAPEDARDEAADDDRVIERAHLLPEEIAAGSDDPTAQAQQILAESDDRTGDPAGTQEESPQTNESSTA